MIRKNSAVRTFLCLLLAFVFTASCLPQTIFATTDKKTVTTWPEGPENNSGAVCLLDADTGAVLYDKNMDEQRYPASITKILTALLIIENKQMTDTVTFGVMTFVVIFIVAALSFFPVHALSTLAAHLSL